MSKFKSNNVGGNGNFPLNNINGRVNFNLKGVRYTKEENKASIGDKAEA